MVASTCEALSDPRSTLSFPPCTPGPYPSLRPALSSAGIGVKHLHEAAHKADLGIYFESNGHGTVLFSHKLRERLRGVGEGCSRGRTRLPTSCDPILPFPMTLTTA